MLGRRERSNRTEQRIVTLEIVDEAVAETLHRLLGYQPASDRFRHDEAQPLDATVVIADEASMIDLAMMDRLVRALRPDARLVLVGDPDQLPSVEAGSVLADLVTIGDAAAAGGPPAGLLARLGRSYRMDVTRATLDFEVAADGAVKALAAACR